MQAESSLEQKDWIDKINGVIASLLTSQSPEMVGVESFYLMIFIYSNSLKFDSFFPASMQSYK